VGHGEEPELRERDGAAGLPEPALEVRLEGRRQRSDRRAKRLSCNEQERQSENP
jgi:hypothetical protein